MSWLAAGAASAALNLALVQDHERRKVDRRNQMYQNLTNQDNKNRAFLQREQDRQRAIEDWNRQNAYNDPAQQMTRLRQAGLNPNLVYGTGANTTAQSIRDSKGKSVENQAPESQYSPDFVQGAGGALSTFTNLKLTKAQTDNINQNIALSKQDAVLKAATTAKTLQETARSKFDLEQANRIKDLVVKEQELRLFKLDADTQYTRDANWRANTIGVQKTLLDMEHTRLRNSQTKAETDSIRQNIKILQDSAKVRKVEAELAEAGIMRDDPAYYKIALKLLHMIGTPFKKAMKDAGASWYDQSPKLPKK